MKDRLGELAFSTVRRLEHGLSPRQLYALLRPLASARAALQRIEPLPGYFSGSTSVQTIRQARTNYLLSRVIEFFPDRLASPKWQSRFQTTGVEHVQEARKNGRRVVLVCFHFGTFKLIPFWLRAEGIPVIALLRGKSKQRSRAKRMKDRVSPFPELPTVLYSEDQLRMAVDVLSGGQVLFVAADRETGKQITLPLDNDWSFQMATGAIRLASHCDAALIPCCMTDEGQWNFRLEIAPPVPLDYLTNGAEMTQAGEHVLRVMLPYLRKHPERCADYLLHCFRRTVPAPLAERSLV